MMGIQLQLIPTLCIVCFGWPSVQLQNQVMDKVITSKVNDRDEIQENFQYLFNSMGENNGQKSETFHKVLKQEALKERQVFVDMREELKIAQYSSAHKTRNFSERTNSNENILARKRETEKENHNFNDDAIKDRDQDQIAGLNVQKQNFFTTPSRAIAVTEISNFRSSIRNADKIMERAFAMNLNGVTVAPLKNSVNSVPEAAVGAVSSEIESDSDADLTLTPLPEKVYANLQPILESKTFRISDDKNLYLREHCGGISWDDINEIALKTVNQFDDPTYLTLRKYRLTASSFGSILHAIQHKSYPPALYKKLLSFNSFEMMPYDGKFHYGILAMRWGRFHESSAFEALRQMHPSWNIKRAGLYLHKSGLLGASPDAITDECVIEIKCPYRFRKEKNLGWSLTPEAKYAISRAKDGTYYVNTHHKYYHQVQAEILFSGREYGLLFIWTPNEAKLFKIEKDESWAQNIDLIHDFYINKFIPYVLDLQKNNETEVNKIQGLMTQPRSNSTADTFFSYS